MNTLLVDDIAWPRGNPEGQSFIYFESANQCVVWYADSMKVGDIIRLLEDDGWYVVAMKGSHRQLKHRTKSGRVTVAGKASDDLAPGTLNSTLKQAGLEK